MSRSFAQSKVEYGKSRDGLNCVIWNAGRNSRCFERRPQGWNDVGSVLMELNFAQVPSNDRGTCASRWILLEGDSQRKLNLARGAGSNRADRRRGVDGLSDVAEARHIEGGLR